MYIMLSDKQIQNLIEEKELKVTDLGIIEDRLSPSGLDLTVGSDYKRPATNEVFDAHDTTAQEIVLEPGEFYLLHTVESLVLPDYIHGSTEELMSRALEGITVTSGVVDPGYSGVLVLGVENRSEQTKRLHPGDKIVQITFQRLDEPAESVYNDHDDAQHSNQTGI